MNERRIIICMLLVCFLLHTSQAFSVARNSLVSANTVEFRTYLYEDWKVRYRYKPAARGHERDSPLLLIHPVGIGLSSWFWDKFLDEWSGGPVYAPDLLGCGSTVWDPKQRDLSFPDSWVQACEALLLSSKSSPFPLWSDNSFNRSQKWSVVTQGGLAPVGVRMAHRNPSRISHLILTSPPTWTEMTTAIPTKELQRNYQFLQSPVLGSAAFAVLETRSAVKFFSNLFLFAETCDSQWLDQVQVGIGVDQRPPVMAFNAGFCQQESYESELMELRQPTLILQGQDDTARNRADYVQKMKNSQLQTVSGKNVLPWENPRTAGEAIREFLSQKSKQIS